MHENLRKTEKQHHIFKIRKDLLILVLSSDRAKSKFEMILPNHLRAIFEHLDLS